MHDRQCCETLYLKIVKILELFLLKNQAFAGTKNVDFLPERRLFTTTGHLKIAPTALSAGRAYFICMHGQYPYDREAVLEDGMRTHMRFHHGPSHFITSAIELVQKTPSAAAT
jgi:hypothetical protein